MSNNKANGKNQKSKVVILPCPILSNGTPIGTAEKPMIETIDCSNVSKSIGTILDKLPNGTELRVMGGTIKIPSGTGTAKFNAIVSKLVEISFLGCDEMDLPKTSEREAFIMGLKGKLHFEQATQRQVLQALKKRKDNYRETVKLEKNKVNCIKENILIQTDTDLKKEINLAFKDGVDTVKTLLSGRKDLQQVYSNVKLLN